MVIARDSLHRLIKAAVDSGRASTFQEAEKLFHQLHLNVFVGPNIGKSQSLLAALGTVINTARRTFLGGVHVIANNDYNVTIPWSKNISLYALCEELGSLDINNANSSAPSIVIGDFDESQVVGTCKIKVTFDRWTAGVVTLGEQPLKERDTYPVAGGLAGALCVSEVFQFIWGQNAYAARRNIVLDLWSLNENPLHPPIPERIVLPKKLWVLGLGHLGQAALWMLGLLPYERRDEVDIVLQDDDSIGESNESTCLLTTRDAIGRKKTRWVADRCEKAGFNTKICERRLESGLILNDSDPRLCFCLPDNLDARKAIQAVPFNYVIEAGIGDAKDTFLQFALHSFPGRLTPSELWKGNKQKIIEISDLPSAYKSLGLDQCGIQELAGVAVGAPFVGAIVGAFVVSEAVRLVNSGRLFDTIRGNLESLAHMKHVEKQIDLEPYNYGITPSLQFSAV